MFSYLLSNWVPFVSVWAFAVIVISIFAIEAYFRGIRIGTSRELERKSKSLHEKVLSIIDAMIYTRTLHNDFSDQSIRAVSYAVRAFTDLGVISESELLNHIERSKIHYRRIVPQQVNIDIVVPDAESALKSVARKVRKSNAKKVKAAHSKKPNLTMKLKKVAIKHKVTKK